MNDEDIGKKIANLTKRIDDVESVIVKIVKDIEKIASLGTQDNKLFDSLLKRVTALEKQKK